MSKSKNTSWNQSAAWYHQTTKQGQGHYFHRQVIVPAVLKLLHLKPGDSILDVGCGDGFLTHHIDPGVIYYGVDSAPGMIALAKKNHPHNPLHHYLVADATRDLQLPNLSFNHAVFILSLQNLREPEKALSLAASALKPQGDMVLVLNHPCFRIPRQSGWSVDEQNKQLKRWVNRYLTPMEIPILMHPGVKTSESTLTFHEPISFYINTLSRLGLATRQVLELASDKSSVGKAKKMENLSRSEIPLFLVIFAQKV